MYAAAGGASLASRQARRLKRQQAGHPDLHQQFKRRLDLLQAQHLHSRLPSYADLHTRLPSTCDITEGKAATAWSERDRRLSTAEAAPRAKHADRRWISRNRIHDSSYGGSSSEEEEGPGLYGEQSAAANALLYVGLGTVAIGLVIAFVGTGEKGFKTVELRLIGPTLIASGLLCCLLRVFLCICPTRCLRRPPRKPRNPSQLDRKTEYYRHLPFNTRTARDFALMEPGPGAGGTTGKKSKKRVSILPAVASASESREIPKILLPEPSPVRGSTDLIELKKMEGREASGRGGGPAESFEDIPSLSSEESLALELAGDAERLARLKSTLPWGDSLDEPPPRHPPPMDADDSSDHLDFFTSQPLDPDTKELVLSPSNLRGQ